MTAEQLAVQRATWVTRIKQDLKAKGYTLNKHTLRCRTSIIVSHPDSPEWWAKVSVDTVSGKLNRIEVNDKVYSEDCDRDTRNNLMAVFSEMRSGYAEVAKTIRRKEKEAAEWQARQDREINGLREVKGVETAIIRNGPHQGKYRVTLHPGNPLEHLSLEHYLEFHRFLVKVS